ncbi:MAG: tetratricopeptide repeat protein, partial [Bryobacteraceae bacterium]
MKTPTRPLLFACLALAIACAAPAWAAPQDAAGAQNADPQQGYSQPDAAKRGDAYYNYTMGHLNEMYYLTTSQPEYATAAIEFYKKAYELDPDSSTIAERLAEMYYQARRIRDAVTEAQGIIQKDPKNVAARRLLVRIYLRTLGDLSGAAAQEETASRAVEQLEQIRRLDPSDKDSAVWLARLYRLRGDADKAEGVLRDILAKDPTNPAAVEQLAQLLLDQNRGPEAVGLLESVTKTSPKAGLLDLLGDAQAQLKNNAKAEEAYRQAMQVDPQEPSHRRGLAQTLLSEEKFDEALEQYKKLSTMDPEDPDNYLRMAEIERQLHRLDDAEKDILQAKQRAPGSLEVVYNESVIYQAQGRFDDAVKVLT